jgi:hypothetical protein
LKKLLLISLALIAFASLASATPVMCAVLMFPNTSGTNGSVCSITPDAGFFISSLTLTGTDDYTGLQSGNPVVTYAATLTQSSPVFGATYCNVTTGTTGSNPCAISVTPSSTVTSLNLSTYSLQLTNATNTVTGGAITGASIVLALNYGETMIPVTGSPEPATLGLMGGALLGLGFLARRKRQ